MQLINRYLIPLRTFKTYRHILGCNDYLSRHNDKSSRDILTPMVELHQVRFFCESSPPRSAGKTLPTLMGFPEIVWPSFIKTARNWIFANFIIRPHLDRDFTMHDFVEGSKQAVEVISAALGESDFATLKNLVSKEAYDELYNSVSKMTVAEREQLTIIRDDIYFTFPYQIGMMFENDNRRWVEITMCYHVLRGLKNMKDSGEDPPLSLGLQPEYQEKLYILNYRFLRDYSKGVGDSGSWIVNIVNHFKLADIGRR